MWCDSIDWLTSAAAFACWYSPDERRPVMLMEIDINNICVGKERNYRLLSLVR